MSDNTINNHSHVEMHYSIMLEDGTVVDSTVEDQSPINFNMEDDVLIDGLKDVLNGLRQGDKESIVLSPEQAFGYRDTENIHTMSLDEFSDDIALEAGLVIGFTTPAGDEVPGMIIDIEGEVVTVDFNHPLAGHQISFEVEILQVNNHV